MRHAWAWFVAAVVPNLVASAIWAWPLFLWHHRHVRRRLDAMHAHLAAAVQLDQPGGGEAR